MIRLNNDYCYSAHPKVLEALAADANNAYPGYGTDSWCEKAAEMLREQAQAPNADVHFLVGGTPANVIIIRHALRPWQSVACADSAHINVHETGAVEHKGIKCECVAAVDGKAVAADVEALVRGAREDSVAEHITQPGMLYISMATETGSVYTLAELEALREVCDKYDLYLFIDGARMGYGLTAIGGDVTLADIARLADVFYLGGTKQGLLFGEAVMILNDELKPYFRNSIKQGCSMLAKGWLAGLQFATILEDSLYFELARKANELAERVRQALAAAKIPLAYKTTTNQVFVVFTPEQLAQLEGDFAFEIEGMQGDNHIMRICTSWATKDSDIDALVAAIEKLA